MHSFVSSQRGIEFDEVPPTVPEVTADNGIRVDIGGVLEAALESITGMILSSSCCSSSEGGTSIPAGQV